MAIDYGDFRRALHANARVFGFRFVSHISFDKETGVYHGGLLEDLPQSHAAWFYCRCAHQLFHEIDSGAQYEGEDDHINMLNNLCRSIAAQYNLESPSLLLQQIENVKAEAMRCGMGWDPRVERPDLADYVNRGGGNNAHS